MGTSISSSTSDAAIQQQQLLLQQQQQSQEPAWEQDLDQANKDVSTNPTQAQGEFKQARSDFQQANPGQSFFQAADGYEQSQGVTKSQVQEMLPAHEPGTKGHHGGHKGGGSGADASGSSSSSSDQMVAVTAADGTVTYVPQSQA